MNNFKSLVMMMLALSISYTSNAQKEEPLFIAEKGSVEIKLNPIGLLLPAILAEVEILQWNYASFSFDFGLGNELFGGAGFFINLRHKYYFNPSSGWDKFYFLSQITVADLDDSLSGIGVGFGAGYKIISKQNVMVDLNFNISRLSNGGVLPLPNLHVGYRF